MILPSVCMLLCLHAGGEEGQVGSEPPIAWTGCGIQDPLHQGNCTRNEVRLAKDMFWKARTSSTVD